MQRYWDLDWKDRAQLTSEGLNNFIAIECAEKGAMLLPAEPTQPIKQVFEKDVTIYKVGNYYVPSMESALTLATALANANLLEVEDDWRSTHTKIKGYSNNTWEQEIKPIQAYSQERWKEIESRKLQYDRELNEYESKLKEYRAIAENRSKATRELSEDYEYQRDVFRWYQKLFADFEVYKNLAGGDETIAKRFMGNAIKTSKVDDYEVFNLAVKYAGFDNCQGDESIAAAA